ncbi:MAG: outer membrane protein [Gemmatimonadales bacterium]
MSRNAALLALMALIAGSATELHAQGRDRGLVELSPRATRGGLYITGGLGNGLEQYQYSDDPLGYTTWLSSPAAVLRIGGTPNQSVRLGAELFGWWNGIYDTALQQNATDNFSAFLIDAQFYPDRRAGFYVKGGLGIARSGESFSYGYSSFSESGFGWSVGAGYDIRLSRNFAIAPTADFYQGTFAQRGQATITEHVLNLGVSLTFQSGGRWR